MTAWQSTCQFLLIGQPDFEDLLTAFGGKTLDLQYDILLLLGDAAYVFPCKALHVDFF